ncbi:MBG domain-containing protein [Myroides pelagicus]|uniref:MBG domain-containing protein n=1 Tax=Myroides pelagicus TaxID=270914 RepID=UPI002DBB75C3|nr:MBG domain-containing protein [Myroides pelagicus]MEC4114663.1 MBG domain-containing protein [Myroides pelagicus]
MGSEGKLLQVYYEGPETGGKKTLVSSGPQYSVVINQISIEFTYPPKLLLVNGEPYVHDFTYEGELDRDVLKRAKFIYLIDGRPGPEGPTKVTKIETSVQGQYTAAVQLQNDQNITPIPRKESVVSVIDTMASLTVDYDGTDYIGKAKEIATAIDLTSLVGVTVKHRFLDNDGKEVTEMINGGVYTIEATYSYERAEDVVDRTTLTINKIDISGGTLEPLEVTCDGNSHPVMVEGVPAGLEVEYIYKDEDDNPIQGEPVNAGTYTVEVLIKGGNNYNDKSLNTTIKIAKAELPGTLTPLEVVYDGNPHPVTVEGVPAGLEVVYTYKDEAGNPIPGAPVNTGKYTVEVLIKGGDNYKDKTLNTTVIIEKTSLVIDPIQKTIVYSGAEQIVVLDESSLPEGVTVTYESNKGIDVGTYIGKAIVNGGQNYENTEAQLTLTIEKADIPGGTLEPLEVTYDGTPHPVTLEGVPAGFDVEYIYKDKAGNPINGEPVDAGDYTVEVIVKGGDNYNDKPLTTTVTINKANVLDVDFIDKVVPFTGEEQTIEITGSLPDGVTVTYENANHTTPGVYSAIANIIGGGNYNSMTLNARFKIVDARTPNSDAEIFELVINGVSYKNPGDVVEHTLKTTPYEDITDIHIVDYTLYSTLSVPKSFRVDTFDPKVYYKDVVITSEDGKVSRAYTIKLIKPIEDRLIILQKFQNTLLINNNPSTNGGYSFASYQWYRNGVVVSTTQSYSVGQSSYDKLDPNDVYYLIVMTTEGEEIHSTRIAIYEDLSKEVSLYPNPVSSSDMTTNIMVDYSEEQFENGRVEILTVEGRFIYRQTLHIGENTIVIPQQLSTGIYLAVIDINGRKQTIRFLVQ